MPRTRHDLQRAAARPRSLITAESGEIKGIPDQEIFMGDFPLMTDKGTFMINGAERVIVSQLVRSPGVYFLQDADTNNRPTFNATIIPNRGAWIEFETDNGTKNDETEGTIGVRIDKNRKIYATTFIRALSRPDMGYDWETDEAILALFDDSPLIANCLEKDKDIKTKEDALKEIYKKLRPGEPENAENAEKLLESLFFDEKRYDLAGVGRYKLSGKLEREYVAARRVDSASRQEGAHARRHDRGHPPPDQSRHAARSTKTTSIISATAASVRSANCCRTSSASVCCVLERVVRERMTVQDIETVTPQALINIRPVVAAIKEFFGSSQLSQFMDQTNSLAELTHKRRLSALGPGGLSRERAGFEVRDVHHSHYGRICPIETPEGPNIGLIGSLATFARVNRYGFIETPYRVVKDGIVTDEIRYFTADREDEYIVAQANTTIDAKGKITATSVVARYAEEYVEEPPDKSPAHGRFAEANRLGRNGADSVPRARRCQPRLDGREHAASGRAVAASAVADHRHRHGVSRRQGLRRLRARTRQRRSRAVDAKAIGLKHDEDGLDHEYDLLKFTRSNAGTCINQRPIVKVGDRVVRGQILADGPSSDVGELALGQNVFVAFMPWEGYNYEDAILISERMVKDDRFTSIHIEEYECEARDTKLGPEEITRDIPNVGEDSLKDLDENGIIRIGAEVRPEDILVGKVTPKGETELTAEERLLRAIFGEKSREVRDTSLKVPHGEKGKIIDVKRFSRENGDELSPGVNHLVRVYVAQKRKILQGDKMAGRHGNKGVIAKVLPEEDMPYTEDGRPVDIVLNPLGVPSRMNLGQIMETHLGWAASMLGFHIATPVFDGAHAEDISEWLQDAGLPADGKTWLRDGRTGDRFGRPITVG